MAQKVYYIKAENMKDAVKKYKSIYKIKAKDEEINSDDLIKGMLDKIANEMTRAGTIKLKFNKIENGVAHATVSFTDLNDLQDGVKQLEEFSAKMFNNGKRLITVGDVTKDPIQCWLKNGEFIGNIDFKLA